MPIMSDVTLRPMTDDEFEEWQQALAVDYAADKVAAGAWAEEGAVERAREESRGLLPDGARTDRMLIFRAVDAEGAPVGRAWVALDPPRSVPGTAFLYDIEVDEGARGRGFGRALLAAVEAAAREAGATALELNVFGPNDVAFRLYESSGFVTTSRQMRKEFPAAELLPEA
jgi:ribosomal protein S18 acetylase RimI-like enzyme